MLKKAVKIIAIVLVVCLVLAAYSVALAYSYIGKTSAAKFSSTEASVEYVKSGSSYDGYASIVVPEGRDIKIMVFADSQVTTSKKYVPIGGSNQKTYSFIEDMVVASKPDLVIFVGDLAMTYNTNQWSYLQRYAEIFERTKTLWAFCFGNHDSQNGYVKDFSNTTKPDGQMNKSKIRKALSMYPHCLVDPTNGNYVINVKDRGGKYVRSLVFFDCEYFGEDNYYRYLTEAQLKWYKNKISELSRRAYGFDSDEVLPTSVFMHVCLAEYLQAALEYSKGNTNDIVYHYGDILQGISIKNNTFSYDETVNDNDAFNTFVEVQSTDSVYFGHLHDNDMSLTYKGIRLTSVQHGGFSHSYRVSIDDDTVDFRKVLNYGDNRGGTVITVSEDGSMEQSQIFGRVVLDNYYRDYAIDYEYYINKFEADPKYTVLH